MAEWVSVEERLPEKGGVALVWDGKYRKVGCYGRFGWHEEYDPDDERSVGHFIYDVTHWMPLPEPPKEG